MARVTVGKRTCQGHDFNAAQNPSVPATPLPHAAEAIALLAAPELPPPPSALRGACIQDIRYKYCCSQKFNLGSNCPCCPTIAFSSNHGLVSGKVSFDPIFQVQIDFRGYIG